MVLTHPDFTVVRPASLAVEITDAEWWLWLRLHELEPTSQLGGILAWKSGFHSTGDYNQKKHPGNYSVRDAPNRTGPLWQWKASALDWTFPEAHKGNYTRIARYTSRLIASGKDTNDPRLDLVLYEAFGQADTDVQVEGWNEFRDVAASSDPSHLFHIHFSFLRSKCGDFWAMWALLTVLMGWTVAQWRASLPGAQQPAPAPVPAPGGGSVGTFMIQINGDPTVHVSNCFEYRGLSQWDTFLFYRDSLKLPYLVVPDLATLRERAGRYWTEDETVQPAPILSDEHLARLEAAARSGALDALKDSSGAISADVLRSILDDEALSLDELADALAAANGGGK